MLAVAPDLAAQARDIDVDRTVEDNHFVAPDAVEDLFAGEDHPRWESISERVSNSFLVSDTSSPSTVQLLRRRSISRPS